MKGLFCLKIRDVRQTLEEIRTLPYLFSVFYFIYNCRDAYIFIQFYIFFVLLSSIDEIDQFFFIFILFSLSDVSLFFSHEKKEISKEISIVHVKLRTL